MGGLKYIFMLNLMNIFNHMELMKISQFHRLDLKELMVKKQIF